MLGQGVQQQICSTAPVNALQAVGSECDSKKVRKMGDVVNTLEADRKGLLEHEENTDRWLDRTIPSAVCNPKGATTITTVNKSGSRGTFRGRE